MKVRWPFLICALLYVGMVLVSLYKLNESRIYEQYEEKLVL